MRQGINVEFEARLNSVLSLHKPDGKLFENIRAYVSDKGILITDCQLPIEVGDKLTRALPSGLRDDFIVDDPGYREGIGGVPSHFLVKFHPLGSGQWPPNPKQSFSGTPASDEQIDPTDEDPCTGPDDPLVPSRKGDIGLLTKADGKPYDSVDFATAEKYAGIGERRRQQLIKDETLKVVGVGLNRRITVESLIKFQPAVENPK
jgi:hypothetical protein